MSRPQVKAKAKITKKHPFWQLKPDFRDKIWTVKDVQNGAAILVDSSGANLFADVGWWEEVRN